MSNSPTACWTALWIVSKSLISFHYSHNYQNPLHSLGSPYKFTWFLLSVFKTLITHVRQKKLSPLIGNSSAAAVVRTKWTHSSSSSLAISQMIFRWFFLILLKSRTSCFLEPLTSLTSSKYVAPVLSLITRPQCFDITLACKRSRLLPG